MIIFPQTVQEAESKASEVVNDIEAQESGSVALVAVIGSVGGLMVVSGSVCEPEVLKNEMCKRE